MDIQLSSSVRQRDVHDTLEKAKVLAKSLGITRVTDTTWLDCIGIPVFASIRPGANEGSLCVNAGKGLKQIEAKVGAYMEAIEFAIAENWENEHLERESKYLSDIMHENEHAFDFIDLCPRFKAEIDKDKKISVVKAVDLVSGSKYWVPAELVFLAPPVNAIGQSIYGSTSNGLASGNTFEEAIVHGISEVIERDVQSFMYLKDTSRYVDLTNAPEEIQSLIHKIDDASLKVSLRYCKNELNQAYFQAYLMEQYIEAPVSIAIGTGCHPVKSIAAIRAITEAAQSRLSHIHGGRDDLIDRVKYFDEAGRAAEIETVSNLKALASDHNNAIKYEEIETFDMGDTSIARLKEYLLMALSKVNIHQVLTVRLTNPQEELQVVKVIIPKLEAFEVTLKRVGRRLGEYSKNEL